MATIVSSTLMDRAFGFRLVPPSSSTVELGSLSVSTVCSLSSGEFLIQTHIYSITCIPPPSLRFLPSFYLPLPSSILPSLLSSPPSLLSPSPFPFPFLPYPSPSCPIPPSPFFPSSLSLPTSSLPPFCEYVKLQSFPLLLYNNSNR